MWERFDLGYNNGIISVLYFGYLLLQGTDFVKNRDLGKLELNAFSNQKDLKSFLQQKPGNSSWFQWASSLMPHASACVFGLMHSSGAIFAVPVLKVKGIFLQRRTKQFVTSMGSTSNLMLGLPMGQGWFGIPPSLLHCWVNLEDLEVCPWGQSSGPFIFGILLEQMRSCWS